MANLCIHIWFTILFTTSALLNQLDQVTANMTKHDSHEPDYHNVFDKKSTESGKTDDIMYNANETFVSSAVPSDIYKINTSNLPTLNPNPQATYEHSGVLSGALNSTPTVTVTMEPTADPSESPSLHTSHFSSRSPIKTVTPTAEQASSPSIHVFNPVFLGMASSHSNAVKSSADSITTIKSCSNEKGSKIIASHSLPIEFYYELSYGATKNFSVLLPIIEENILQDVGQKLLDCNANSNATNQEHSKELRIKTGAVSSVSSDPADSVADECSYLNRTSQHASCAKLKGQMTLYLNQNISLSEEEIIYNEAISVINQGMQNDIYIDLRAGIWQLHFICSSSIEEEAIYLKDSKGPNDNGSVIHHENVKISTKSIMVGALTFCLSLIIIILPFVRKKYVDLEKQRVNYPESFSNSSSSSEFEKENYDSFLIEEEEYSDYIRSLENNLKVVSSNTSPFTEIDKSFCSSTSSAQINQNQFQLSTKACSVEKEDLPSVNGTKSKSSNISRFPKFDETVFISTSSQGSTNQIQLPTKTPSTTEEQLEKSIETSSSYTSLFPSIGKSISSSVQTNTIEVSTKANSSKKGDPGNHFSFCGACRTKEAWKRNEPVFVSVASAPLYPFEHNNNMVCYNCGTRIKI